jgi:glycosyltransferase involved in cell wall biosynthesis
LESVARQTVVDDIRIRVLIADNDPDRHEAMLVANELSVAFPFELRAELVAHPGISAVRNVILDHGDAWAANFIAMIDDDETADPNWLRELIEVQRRFGADLVSGPSIPTFEGPVSPEILHAKAFWYNAKLGDELVSLFHATNNVLLSRDALVQLGALRFDDAFGLTGGGDKEFFTRLKKRGATFAWASKAITYEHVPSARLNTRWILRRNYRIGIDDVRIALMHEGPLSSSRKIAEALAMVVAIPVTAPALLIPRLRLRMMRRWTRAFGRLSAAFGRHYPEYGALRS